MKKYLKLIILFIIIIAMIIIIKINIKPEYTLDEIRDIVNVEIPNNMYFKEMTTISKNGSKETFIIEILKKDQYIYYHSDKYEELCNYENNSLIRINNKDKEIELYNKEVHNPLDERLNMFESFINSNAYKYKYLGKENINGQECIKILFKDMYSETYIYIDVPNKVISKFESYNKKNNESTISDLIYSNNIVKDEDILKFDIDNYPDYSYIEYSD